jgi:hypothetical protein
MEGVYASAQALTALSAVRGAPERAGAATTIITTAAASTSKPVRPVSQVAVARSPLTTGVIVLPRSPIVAEPRTSTLEIGRTHYDGAGPRMSSGVFPRRRTCWAASTKRFFGYSDNTNLHLFLWNLGLVSYLGGSIMAQFGWPVTIHPCPVSPWDPPGAEA